MVVFIRDEESVETACNKLRRRVLFHDLIDDVVAVQVSGPAQKRFFTVIVVFISEHA